jgi:hypothetical protein
VNRLTGVAKWGLALAITCVLQPTPAAAIPVFARIYDKPCGTCHTVFPQLNPQGETFRAHGFHGLPTAVKPLHAGSLEVPGTPKSTAENPRSDSFPLGAVR